MVRRVYAMKDNGVDNTPILIKEDDACDYNQNKYGIFREVNSFNGSRTIANLSNINFWYAEIDGGDKADQITKIRRLPIYPTILIESKNGFHIYFKAQDATQANYKVIQNGLGEFLGGDPKVRDLSRILRVDGFYHWKDSNNPFMVKRTLNVDVSYREKEMLYFFPTTKVDDSSCDSPDSSRIRHYLTGSSEDLTSFLNVLDHEEALKRLSGTQYVNFEKYAFKTVYGGKKNIYVNGKSTNCFIDNQKKIGAIPGGPTVFNWLRYYGHPDKECYRIIREILWT